MRRGEVRKGEGECESYPRRRGFGGVCDGSHCAAALTEGGLLGGMEDIRMQNSYS